MREGGEVCTSLDQDDRKGRGGRRGVLQPRVRDGLARESDTQCRGRSDKRSPQTHDRATSQRDVQVASSDALQRSEHGLPSLPKRTVLNVLALFERFKILLAPLGDGNLAVLVLLGAAPYGCG